MIYGHSHSQAIAIASYSPVEHAALCSVAISALKDMPMSQLFIIFSITILCARAFSIKNLCARAFPVPMEQERTASVTNNSMPQQPTLAKRRRQARRCGNDMMWNGSQAMTLSQWEQSMGIDDDFSRWELLVLEESDFDTTDYDGKCKGGSDLGGEGNISGSKARSRSPEGKRKDGSDQSGDGNISGGKARNFPEGKRKNCSDHGGEGNISGCKGRSRSPGRAVPMLTASSSNQ